MTVLVYVNRHRQFRRVRRIYTTPPTPSNLVVKRWPNRWLRRRPLKGQPFSRRRAFIRYPIAGPPAGFIARGRALRPKIKRGKRFLRAKGVFLRAPLLFAPRRHLKIKRARLRLRPRLYSIAGAPAGFVPAKRMFRVRIRRGRRFMRKVYPILPQALLLFARFKRPKVRRRVLRMGPRRYSIAGPPVGFVQYHRAPRPKIRRWRKFARKVYPFQFQWQGYTGYSRWYKPRRVPQRLQRRTFPFLPAGPLIWQRPRFLRPKVKHGRRFIIRHPYTTPPVPASYVLYRPFPRPKVRRPKISLRRFQLRYYEFPGAAIVTKIVDWLVRARRRGRR